MSRIRKYHIKLAEVIILDHFCRYTVVPSSIHEFLQFAHSTLRSQRVELQHSFIAGGCKSFFENILLTDNFIVTVYHLSYICGKRHLHKWRGSVHFCKITRQIFDKYFQILPLGSLACLHT